MTKTGFLWLETGDITWAGLLDGSVGVIGALLVAWFAFWLQRRHDRAKELQEAVEEYRAALTSMVTTWPLNSRRRSEPDLALDMPAFEAALQKAAKVSARCGWRDAALREGDFSGEFWPRFRMSFGPTLCASARVVGTSFGPTC